MSGLYFLTKQVTLFPGFYPQYIHHARVLTGMRLRIQAPAARTSLRFEGLWFPCEVLA